MKMASDINNLYKFMDNMNMNTGHVSNVYVARLYSPNGDVKEYYGMNLLTDLGFKQFFDTDNNINFASNLYVGDGTGSFNKTSTKLMSPLFNGLAASTIDSSISYKYPLYYAKGDQNDNGRITTVTRYKSFRYSENITDVLSDVVISDIHLGSIIIDTVTDSLLLCRCLRNRNRNIDTDLKCITCTSSIGLAVQIIPVGQNLVSTHVTLSNVQFTWLNGQLNPN